MAKECAVCGKKIGVLTGHIIFLDGYVCTKCYEAAGYNSWDGNAIARQRTKTVAQWKNKENYEIRKKCNVCGKIFCYTEKDLDDNVKNAKRALGDGISALGHAVGGSSTASAINNANARSALGGIVDYNRCPQCGSFDLKQITKDEWDVEQVKAQAPVAPARSSADELKSFKELLDMGIITQEEFDAKKKQLLGL